MARIFIAIRFDDELKKTLVALQQTLKAKGVAGNYCSYGNLHMTLAFIGESVFVKPKEQNKACFDSLDIQQFIGCLSAYNSRTRHILAGTDRYSIRIPVNFSLADCICLSLIFCRIISEQFSDPGHIGSVSS